MNKYFSKKRKRVYLSRPLEERFWERVNKVPTISPGCWLWEGGIMNNGYGTIFIDKRPKSVMRLAHRISWELNVGKIPRGIQVLHHCDVRSCVNPDHLFLGTQRDNIHDAMAKGRLNTSGLKYRTCRSGS